MHVFVKATEKKKNNDEEEKEERKIKCVPHKQLKAEALKKKKKPVIKTRKASVTSKEFSNKKFQKLLDQGVKDLKDYYRDPCILQKFMILSVDVKQTLKYLVKQLEFYDMLVDFQIARLPKYFRPYAELHFKKAFVGKLPDNIMENTKHIFHIFHKIGVQKRYASNYKAHLHKLISHMNPIFKNQEELVVRLRRMRNCLFIIIKHKNRIKIRKTRKPIKILYSRQLKVDVTSAIYIIMMDIIFIQSKKIKMMTYRI
jgi:hypothetical protein